MDFIVVDGMPPYDGRYEWDALDTGFTTREWGWIKRISGYLPDTLADGWGNGDTEVTLLFAVIAMRRAGKISAADVPAVFEKLSDAPPQSILRWEHEGVEDDAGPPAQPSPARSNGSDSSSGNDSPTSSERSVSAPKPTGTPASDTLVLPPVRSGT